MLILPIGVEQNEVRRTPWVSWAIIAACFLAHIWLSVLGPGAEQEADRRVHQAFRYLAQRPYLSPPPALLALLAEEGQGAVRQAAIKWEAQGAVVAPAVAEPEQRELNRLAGEAVASLRLTVSNRLGFVPARPNPLSLVTYTLVHAGWMHLLGNMLFFFLTGPFIEDLYGRGLFAVLYFISGVAGAGAFAAKAPDSAVALVGASGAIAGVMGAFLVRLSARRIEFLVLPIPIVPTFRFKLKLPAFVVIPLWAAEQVYFAAVAQADSPVAFSAHIGGFAIGVAFALAIALLHVEERIVNPAIERQISIEQNPAITRAADALVAGDVATARRLIDGVLKTEPMNVDAWTQLWEIGLETADTEVASRAGLRLIELHGRGRDRDMVWSIVNDPRWRPVHMTSRFLTTAADLLARAGDAREAMEIYRKIVAEVPADDEAVLRALVAEGELLLRAGEHKEAQRVFEEARAHPACSGAWVERMKRAAPVGRPA